MKGDSMRLVRACALLALAACAASPEVTAWRMALEVDTPAAYRDFTARYPRSSHADDARERAALAERARAEKATTVAECVAILRSQNPSINGDALADLAFKAAQTEQSVDAQYLFLEHFRSHPGAAQVRSRLETLELEEALRDSTPAALEGFILRHPASAQEGRVRTLLAERTFAETRDRGGQLAFKAFVARFPDSERAAEVRGWIVPSVPRAGDAAVQDSLDEALRRTPALQRRSCALALSATIRKGSDGADDARRMLRELQRDEEAVAAPGACEGARLVPRARQEDSLAEALAVLLPLQTLRQEQVSRHDAFRERGELARAAATASASLADELETAELSEQVLGAGPLGGIDVGPDKGSHSARRAHEQLRSVQKSVEGNLAEVAQMLAETERLHRTLVAYVSGCVDAR